VEYRAANSGMLHSVDEVEFAQNNYMAPGILENQVIKDMQQNVVLVGSLSNDIFSFEKETIRDGLHHANLVHVAMTTEGLSIKEASEKTSAIVRCHMDSFYSSMSEVDNWHLPAVSKYCIGLENFLLGCWPWQLSTKRYCSVSSPFTELLLPKRPQLIAEHHIRSIIRCGSTPNAAPIGWALASPVVQRHMLRVNSSGRYSELSSRCFA